ncbi:MAG: ribbon-helix-helix protein, CopG family [Chloroflexota bacterium]|nr:ribbon-helix-helix protein, CopG family [Chloroflexota bacterium]
MVRTQIQLRADQAAKLQQLAVRRGVSMAELVREGVDRLLRESEKPDFEARRQRALAAAGRYNSGLPDIAESHDEYLAEAFADED